MLKNILVKIVYEDDGNSKSIKGKIIREDDFCIDVEAITTGHILTLGKKNIVLVRPFKDK